MKEGISLGGAFPSFEQSKGWGKFKTLRNVDSKIIFSLLYLGYNRQSERGKLDRTDRGEKMDCLKIGELIRSLRKEKEMTQNELANKLNISDKTISKWERGLGCPDITLIAELSEILGVDLAHMLKGDLLQNDFGGGNMKNSSFYICPTCGNITVSTGEASVSCCGRKMEEKAPRKAETSQKLKVVLEEDQWYITSEHPMEKETYISFVAYLVGGAMQLVKLYPEWDMHLRLTRQGHGKLVWYSTSEGLFYQLI